MTDASSKIDLNVITMDAFQKLYELDRTFIGTPNYMGVTYFWGLHGYKHYLRESSTAQRRKIHKKWLAAGLDLLKETDEHYRIIGSVMKQFRQEIVRLYGAYVPTTAAAHQTKKHEGNETMVFIECKNKNGQTYELAAKTTLTLGS